MSEPLRILRIITRLNVGGPSLQAMGLSEPGGPWVTRLLSGRLKDGEEDMSGHMSPDVEQASVPHLVHPISPITDWKAVNEIRQHIRDFKPDLVHTHHAKAGMVGRLAARWEGVPVVHTFHGNVFRGHYSPLMSTIIVLVERGLAPLASRLIAISKNQKKDLTDVFKIADDRQVCVIPLGFHLERFTQNSLSQKEARTELNLPPDKKLIGIVGRLTHVKNHRFFVQAGSQLGPDCDLAIVGNGELEDSIRQQVKELGLENRVHFRPTHPQVERVYAALDVLAITSHSEGTPVTMIEAMAQGLPVVASQVGGIVDLADDNRARMYTPQNEREFVDAVTATLTAHDETHRQIERAKSYALGTHSFASLQSSLDSLYREILA